MILKRFLGNWLQCYSDGGHVIRKNCGKHQSLNSDRSSARYKGAPRSHSSSICSNRLDVFLIRGTLHPLPSHYRAVRLATLLLFWFAWTPVYSAMSQYEAFDFKQCLVWSLRPDAGGTSDESKAGYRNAERLLDSHPRSIKGIGRFDETEWETGRTPMIFSAVALPPTSKRVAGGIEKFGVCIDQKEPTRFLFCLPGQDFPLSGAKYVPSRFRGKLPTLKCVTGCQSAPAYIHDTGYEPEEGETNFERKDVERRFRATCRSN